MEYIDYDYDEEYYTIDELEDIEGINENGCPDCGFRATCNAKQVIYCTYKESYKRWNT